MTVHIEGLTLAHGGSRSRHREVNDVTLTLEAGTCTALVGPSGAGKSTLLQGLQGFLRPVGGRLRFDGKDPWSRGQRKLFGRVGTLLQDPTHQLFAATLRHDVAWGLRPLRLATAEVARRVDGALERVGLDPSTFGDRSPWELSGGERRRAALAGLLVVSPGLLLLDEPTAGLDAPSRQALLADLERLTAGGTTVLWTSHDLEDVWAQGLRLAVLDGGRLAAWGEARDLLARPDLAESLGWDPVPAVAVALPWNISPHPDPEVAARRVEEVTVVR